MGFPIAKLAGRAALIGVMLGGGLLYAGISQAQEVGELDREAIAAVGGPADLSKLKPVGSETAAVDARDGDVAGDEADVAPSDTAKTGAPAPVASATNRTPSPAPLYRPAAYSPQR